MGLQSHGWINFSFFQNLERAYLMISAPKEIDFVANPETVNENTRMREKINDIEFKTSKISE